MNWSDLMNPRSNQFRRAMFDILQQKYAVNEAIVERVSVTLQTEGDMNAFLKLVTDIYEMAYMKAVNDHRDQLTKMGLSARIVPQSRQWETPC